MAGRAPNPDASARCRDLIARLKNSRHSVELRDLLTRPHMRVSTHFALRDEGTKDPGPCPREPFRWPSGAVITVTMLGGVFSWLYSSLWCDYLNLAMRSGFVVGFFSFWCWIIVGLLSVENPMLEKVFFVEFGCFLLVRWLNFFAMIVEILFSISACSCFYWNKESV